MNINKTTKAILLVSSGVAAGSLGTYFVMNTRLKKKYIAIAEAEIESVKAAHRKFDPDFDFSTATPEAVVKEQVKRREFLDKLDELQYQETEPNQGPVTRFSSSDLDDAHYNHTEVIEANDPRWPAEEPFEKEQPEYFDKLNLLNEGYWPPESAMPNVVIVQNLEDPLPERDTSKPYVISVNEFNDECTEYDKNTITYYEGDDTLVDERESIIPDINTIIGLYSLTRFGKESTDPSVVYVRNEQLHIDFEVIKDDGDYTEVVLGIIPMQEREPIRKMRSSE